MSEGDKMFAGSIPENYDRYLVPLIFEVSPGTSRRRAAALSPRAVLETAAGSGVVTRALAPKTFAGRQLRRDRPQPADARLCRRATERDTVSAGARQMHRRCRSKMPPSMSCAASSASCSSPTARRATARHGGYSSPGTFPVQRLGSHRGERVCGRRDERARGIFPERSAALPGAHAARLSRHRADPERIGEGRFFQRGDRDRAEQSRAPSPRHPAVAYCQGTPLRNEIEARDADKLEAATDHAASAIANKHGSGEVAAKIQAHVVMAWT